MNKTTTHTAATTTSHSPRARSAQTRARSAPLLATRYSLLATTSAAALAAATLSAADTPQPARPNIIYILADDMGLGDISAYNPNSAWKTPGVDRLAREGTRFTDSHTSSSLCTPSRYSILTGRYNWRSSMKSGVGSGLSAPVIERNRPTLATLLKQNGYATAMFGKWHLGIDWPRKSGSAPARDGGDTTDDNEKPYTAPKAKSKGKGKNKSSNSEVDFTKPFTGGPTSHGFDTYLGISASLDMPPYLWLRDNRVDPENFPFGHFEGNQTNNKQLLAREGDAGKNFRHIDVLPRLRDETIRYIQEHARKNAAGAATPSGNPKSEIRNPQSPQPFFIYLALTAPHTPILPTKQFAGATRTNAYGDFCVQVDDVVVKILAALDAAGIADNTLIVFATDNGCSPLADFKTLAKFHHDPVLGMRGAKAEIYEGGHRVPFVVRWPAGGVLANRASDELIYQGDFFATCADIVGAKIPANAAEDSVSILPVLLGKKLAAPLHEALVHHSGNGAFAIRQGPWKLCLTPDAGAGNYTKLSDVPANKPPFQLFNLADDPAEKTNLYKQHPEIVQRLGALLIKYIRDGRSTPGAPQKNTGPETWQQLDWMKKIK